MSKSLHKQAALFVPTLLALAILSQNALADRYRTTQSDFGGVGLLQTPTARFADEGAFSFNANRVSPYSRYSISVTPLPWLEGTLRYTTLNNRRYSASEEFSGDQSLKDKAMDAKFRLWEESYWIPQIALGFVDVGGTGLFSSEYFVANKRFWDLDLSLGIAWGYHGNRGDISNPFGGLRDSERAGRAEGDRGGNFNTSTYFSGPAAFFGGVEYQTPWDRLRLKVEMEGNDYSSEPGDPDFEVADSRFNIGAVFKVRDGIDISAGWERGNTAMIGITFSTNLKTGRGPEKFLDPEPEARRPLPAGVSGQTVDWANVSDRLKDNAGFEVEEIAIKDREVIVTGEQTTYRNEAEGVTRASRVLDNSLGEGTYDWYTLVNKPRGMAVSETSINPQRLRDYEQNAADTEDLRRGIVNATPSVVSKDVVHTAELDKFDWGLSLGYKQNMGGPDGFILYQFLARVNAEYRFNRNNWVRGNLGVNLLNNYDKFEMRGTSNLPQVRTHIREYLVTSDVVLENLQYTHTRQLDRDVYTMAYVGLLESMFGGVGGEVLYRPFDAGWAIGVDANWVKQRGFRQNFDFRDYSTWTGHITGYSQTRFWDILAKGSAGRYLAGDYGATLDLSRRFANGVTVGAWATRTDVSSEDFGEGSFDKGIYFTFPFDAFFSRSTTSAGTIAWNPTTRDGGARLARQYGLYNMTNARNIDHFNDGFGLMTE
ncbi:Exopolysaccharide biosynthesis protein YbjH [Halopseudomonas bauzanensis]|uniref:Exopolysaccharide biosynthesis protein YbjH n=1 Tax=Halopseudomonas bauzanensis TaxID=653930 RepID=A0A1I4J802_9GAMM|nr:Exopolysaccharide biosynthesis protein YbjH [Halopseudomonas bauzanensis]SFL62725.1 Exopolysaccharide biosynthesis protein YbjH [Halopseudomonas bauzanensis]